MKRSLRAPSIAVALAAASCAAPPPPPSEVPRVEIAVAAPPAGERLMDSSATTLAAYQREIAERVHAANADRIYEGRPPNPLRAIIVYRAEIDAEGRPVRVQLYRSPGAPELEASAADSLRRAAPFPRPSPALLRAGGRVRLIETWLFDYDGRFRLRTLALPQSAD